MARASKRAGRAPVPRGVRKVMPGTVSVADFDGLNREGTIEPLELQALNDMARDEGNMPLKRSNLNRLPERRKRRLDGV